MGGVGERAEQENFGPSEKKEIRLTNSQRSEEHMGKERKTIKNTDCKSGSGKTRSKSKASESDRPRRRKKADVLELIEGKSMADIRV
jgi:hypothetical protein